MTFLAATVVFPAVLVLLAVGAGLLVDRLSGRSLPLVLVPVAGLALLICTGVSAVVTPPDVFSMICMLVPMYLLFELGILLLRLMPARKVAAGTVLSLGTETRDGADAGGEDATARPDDR